MFLFYCVMSHPSCARRNSWWNKREAKREGGAPHSPALLLGVFTGVFFGFLAADVGVAKTSDGFGLFGVLGVLGVPGGF